MPDAELHADFDRDGRMSGGAAEYAARASAPGAIVGINVDRDGRALPAAARSGSAVALDFSLATRDGRDADPLPLAVVLSAAVAGFASLALRVEGDNAAACALLDDRAHLIAPASSRVGRVEFALPLTRGRHSFKLEAQRPPGSPLGAADGRLMLSLVGRDAAGAETVLDSGRAQLARFLVLGDLGPAEKLYMASLPDNQPAVSDVRAALADISPAVELRLIDMADSMGDAWLQDQFQLGYIPTPGGSMRAILHMPRFRKNAQVGPSQRNLAELVRAHFPSTNLGLIDDFWQRRVTIRHLGGSTPVSFQLSEEAFRILHKVDTTETFLRDAIRRLCAAARELRITPAPTACENLPQHRDSLPLARQQLPELALRVEQLATRVLAAATSSQAAGVQALRARARALVQEVDRGLRVAGTAGAEVYELALSAQTFRMEGFDIIDLHATVARMHDSLVYGGNIEASPPLAGFPYGKVVLGEGDERVLDPPVRDLFEASAAVQPVVAIDTSWLGVGHVDELITFLPNRRAAGQHAIMRASPELAFALFDKAAELYLAGLPPLHPDRFDSWRPLTIMRHRMNSGTHPITRMFRGKLWLHSHPHAPPSSPDDAGGAPTQDSGETSNPPEIYLRLVDWYSGLLGRDLAPFFPDGEQDNQYYKAALSIWDFEFFEGGTNQRIVDDKLADLDALLTSEFGECGILKVPVLFDRADELGVGATSAFTPDLVNLQYLNGTALIPNPFGPRMLPADAAQVIQHVLREQGLGSLAAGVSARYFQRKGLDVLDVWINRDVDSGARPGPFRSAADLAREFGDGFPGLHEDEIATRIRRANRAAFDGSGDLRDGWRKIRIPETTVDLFQAYTQVLLDSLNVGARWVDSWFYHVRFGEIHCGTNVLRAAPAIRTPWWAPP